MNSKDIIGAAMQMEEHGRDFYLTMAERTKDAEAKKLFLKLAEEEKEHAAFFKKMLQKEGSNFQVNEHKSDFIEAIISRIDFPSLGQHISEVANINAALAIGIQAEKDSILLYNEMLEEILDPDLKKVISGLLKAEKMHLVELRNYLEELD